MTLVRYGRYCLRDVETFGDLLPHRSRMSLSRRSATESKCIRQHWCNNLSVPRENVIIQDNNVAEFPVVASKPKLLQKVVGGIKGLFKKR